MGRATSVWDAESRPVNEYVTKNTFTLQIVEVVYSNYMICKAFTLPLRALKYPNDCLKLFFWHDCV